ncbi:MAG: rRNA maturation RNase YbeY [Bacteroidota bacterium]|nr:rRNA maturation RNase YbeY [Bacteroidota bacterium]
MINFHSEDIKFTLKNKSVLKEWIRETIQKKKRKAGDISYVFCSDEYLLVVNKQYLDHDTFTDIITFDYSKEDVNLPVSGDIFISIDRVKENALKFSKSFDDELYRVIIHGALHLLGFKDKTKNAKAEMRKEEDRCIKELQNILPLRH